MKQLRQYIRQILLTEATNDLEKLVQQFRNRLENYNDWEDDKACFAGTCSSVSEELTQFLISNGVLDAERINGFYLDASDDYEPNMDYWDQEDIWKYNEDIEYGDIPPANHWWVQAQGMIIDVTADQFHPNEESDYRVVIVPIGNRNYD